jgi:hypothetical protein
MNEVNIQLRKTKYNPCCKKIFSTSFFELTGKEISTFIKDYKTITKTAEAGGVRKYQ